MVRVPSHINIIALGLVPKLFKAVVLVGFPITHCGFQGFQQALVNGLGVGVNPVDVGDFPTDVEQNLLPSTAANVAHRTACGL
eukprot:11666828-Heterocapsa_arctica.AAC.1